MEEGTQYWMEKFMESQADYYKEAIYNANKAYYSFNKEEKMIHDANKVLKADENENDYYWYVNGGLGKLGVYANQGKTAGEAPCDIFNPNNYNPIDNNPGVGVCGTDLLNMIKRQ